MIVVLTIIILVAIVRIAPRAYKGYALGFSAIVLGVLYFFFIPPEGYDLYRQYAFIDFIKELKFGELFERKYIIRNSLLTEYNGTSSNVYLAYVWIISKLSAKGFLPCITAVIVYGLAGNTICKTARRLNAKSSAMTIAFVVFVFTIDYRSVSGIRNILAYSVFAYTIYIDLIEKKHRPICFLMYYLLCQVHMTIVIFCVIRVAILFANKVTKKVIIIACLCAFSMLSLIQQLLAMMPENAYVAMFLHKSIRYILRYDEGLEVYALRRALSSVTMIVMYLVVYYMCRKTKKLPKSFEQYNLFYLSTIAITLGAVLQYDLFVRNCMMISCLSIPYVMFFWNSSITCNRCSIRIGRVGNLSSNTVRVCVVIVSFLVIYALVYNTYAFYFPMNQYFMI